MGDMSSERPWLLYIRRREGELYLAESTRRFGESEREFFRYAAALGRWIGDPLGNVAYVIITKTPLLTNPRAQGYEAEYNGRSHPHAMMIDDTDTAREYRSGMETARRMAKILTCGGKMMMVNRRVRAGEMLTHNDLVPMRKKLSK